MLEIYGRRFKVEKLRPSKIQPYYNSQLYYHGVYNYGVFLISVYITEYFTINKNTKVAVRGVLMYREKRDLSERRKGRVMVIFVCYRAFPKKSQRREIWKKLCWSELKKIHVEFASYYLKNELVNLGKSDRHVFGFEVRALRRRLRPDQKKLFDSFYYQK